MLKIRQLRRHHCPLRLLCRGLCQIQNLVARMPQCQVFSGSAFRVSCLLLACSRHGFPGLRFYFALLCRHFPGKPALFALFLTVTSRTVSQAIGQLPLVTLPPKARRLPSPVHQRRQTSDYQPINQCLVAVLRVMRLRSLQGLYSSSAGHVVNSYTVRFRHDLISFDCFQVDLI